jgi:hypothetical protein
MVATMKPLSTIAAAALALGALRCAAPPPPAVTAAPPPPPPPVVVVTASAAPVAAPAPVQEPIDPAADATKLAVVRSLCDAAIKHDKDAVLVGCRSCPPFEGEERDGIVAIDPASFWPLESLVRGSFSRPGADEVAAIFEGCEPHAANYGGTLFAAKTATGYKAMTYASGLHPERCEPYRRKDGRDLLVCSWSDAHQSTAFTQVLAYDLTRAVPDDPLKGWSALATVSRNDYAVCWGVSPEVGVVQGKLLGYHFEDRNRDGVPDLVIEVLHRRTPLTPALDKRVLKACAEAQAKDPDDGRIDVPALVGKPAKETLELIFDGQGFRPTTKTAAILKRLGD